ncbi:hypothetical protein ACO1PF_04730 [Alkalibacterium sp. f15]|uniref:hypothetical protein n=1 Tax=Alkalibacterium sp. f15 TaxID=3414029 RepID=UPI003BF79C5F
MAIIIKRDTEAAGSLLKFKVWIKDIQVAKLAQKEVKELPIPEEEAVLQIRKLNGKSNKLVVNCDYRVKVTNGPGFLLMFLFMVMLIPVLKVFNGTARWISSALFILGFILILQLVNVYKLENLDDSRNS